MEISMRKIIVILLLLVLSAGFALGASRYWFGMKTEEQFRKYLKEVQQPGLSTVITEYERGFFSSTVKTVVTMQVYNQTGSGGPDVVTLPLEHTVVHGPIVLPGDRPEYDSLKPFMAYVVTRPAETVDGTDIVSNFFSGLPWVLYTLINLDGSGETRMQGGAFEKEIVGDNERFFLNMLDADIRMNFGVDMRSIAGAMLMGGFTMEGEKGTVEFKGISGTLDMRRGEYGLNLGSVHSQLDEMAVIAHDAGQSFVMKGISGEIISRLDGALVFSEQKFSVKRMIMAEHVVGPVEFAMELRNLNALPLGKIQELVAELQTDGAGALAAQEKFQTEILALLPRLLAKSPELEVTRARLTTDYGDIDGSMFLRIDGQSSVNLFTLLGALYVQVDARMPEALLLKSINKTLAESDKHDRNGRALIKEMVEQGYLRLENGDCLTSIHFEKGRFSINGHDIPLHNLLQKFQSAPQA